MVYYFNLEFFGVFTSSVNADNHQIVDGISWLVCQGCPLMIRHQCLLPVIVYIRHTCRLSGNFQHLILIEKYNIVIWGKLNNLKLNLTSQWTTDKNLTILLIISMFFTSFKPIEIFEIKKGKCLPYDISWKAKQCPLPPWGPDPGAPAGSCWSLLPSARLLCSVPLSSTAWRQQMPLLPLL